MLDANGTTRSRSALIYGAALLVLAMLACAIYLAAQSWREARSDQSRQLATIAELGGIAVDTYLVQLEISMRNLGAELTEMQGKASRDKPDLDYAFKLVSRFQKLHSELGVVMLIRGDGQLLLTGNAPHSDDLPTLANDPTFLEFRAELLQAPAFAIGKPVMGYIDKSWAVAARYAVTDQSGKLLYILSANLPANLLQNYWTEATSPKISALGLIRNDGYLVSRYPVPDAASLNELYAQPAADEMMAYLRANNHQQSGQVEMPGADGKPMLRLIRRLQHYPLTLFVEMPLSEVKAAGRGSMQLPYLFHGGVVAGEHRRFLWLVAPESPRMERGRAARSAAQKLRAGIA